MILHDRFPTEEVCMAKPSAPTKKAAGPRTYRQGVEDVRKVVLDFLEAEYMRKETERGSKYGQEILTLTRQLSERLRAL